MVLRVHAEQWLLILMKKNISCVKCCNALKGMEILHNLGKLVTQNKVYVAKKNQKHVEIRQSCKIFNLGDLIYT